MHVLIKWIYCALTYKTCVCIPRNKVGINILLLTDLLIVSSIISL